jgi:hypothetical protein
MVGQDPGGSTVPQLIDARSRKQVGIEPATPTTSSHERLTSKSNAQSSVARDRSLGSAHSTILAQ